MKTIRRQIAVTPDTHISAVWAVPDSRDTSDGTAIIIAHGAGNDMDSPFLSHVHESLAQKGMIAVKFNFPYTEQGRKAPDRAAVLEAAWRAVIAAVRDDPTVRPHHLFLGGKSMGGRIASQIAAEGEACAGLVFLGYPLHPPNRPENLRAAHLRHIACPLLFIQGTRDTLCRLVLLQNVLATLPAPHTLHLIEGADHSFKVLKSLGRPERDVWDEIVDVVAGWLSAQARKG